MKVSIPQAEIINMKLARSNIGDISQVSIPQAEIINMKLHLEGSSAHYIDVSIPQAEIINMKHPRVDAIFSNLSFNSASRNH